MTDTQELTPSESAGPEPKFIPGRSWSGLLTVRHIEASRWIDRDHRLTDDKERGLFLDITQRYKNWKYRYTYVPAPGQKRKDKVLHIAPLAKEFAGGTEGGLTLGQARDAARRLTQQREAGMLPGVTNAKKPNLQHAAPRDPALPVFDFARVGDAPEARPGTLETFQQGAERWHRDYATPTYEPKYARQVMLRLRKDIFPYIGDRLVVSPNDDTRVNKSDLIACLQRIAHRGAYTTAQRMVKPLRESLQFMLDKARADKLITEEQYNNFVNPAADLGKRFPRKRRKVKHHTPLPWDQVPYFVVRLDNWDVPQTRAALFTTLYTAQRADAVVGALRSEFHLNHREPYWHIPAARMKGEKELKEEHHVPLPRQLVRILRDYFKLLDRMGITSPFAFPPIYRSRSKHRGPALHIAHDSLRILIQKRLGFVATTHGLRGTFSTYCNGVSTLWETIVEAQLAHVKDPIPGAYNQQKYWPHRVELMQLYADHIDAAVAALPALQSENFPKAA